MDASSFVEYRELWRLHSLFLYLKHPQGRLVNLKMEFLLIEYDIEIAMQSLQTGALKSKHYSRLQKGCRIGKLETPNPP